MHFSLYFSFSFFSQRAGQDSIALFSFSFCSVSPLNCNTLSLKLSINHGTTLPKMLFPLSLKY